MKNEKKINYDINYVVVKCESKAHEKIRFAIRNGVCEPEVEIVGGYYYLFWRNWDAQQTKLIMIIVNKLLQNKNSGYRFVFFRKGENDYDYEWFSNCENAFEFMRESTLRKGEKK